MYRNPKRGKQAPAQEKINKLLKVCFSRLFHLTTFHSAVSILRSRTIFGLDTERHANFTVGRPRPDLARGDEVLLLFEFSGQHAAIVGVPFGQGVPSCPGLNAPVAFHVFPEVPNVDLERAALSDIPYWQTNLYPGANQLYLSDARLLQPRPDHPRHTGIIWPWQTRRFLDQIDDHHQYGKRLRVLDRLRARAMGTEFRVPAAPR